MILGLDVSTSIVGVCILENDKIVHTDYIDLRKIKNFFEVILKCSPDSCAKRDYKNQYEKALSGEYVCFPGITEKYEMSDFPDLIIDTENNDIEKSFDILIQNTKKHIKKDIIL